MEEAAGEAGKLEHQTVESVGCSAGKDQLVAAVEDSAETVVVLTAAEISGFLVAVAGSVAETLAGIVEKTALVAELASGIVVAETAVADFVVVFAAGFVGTAVAEFAAVQVAEAVAAAAAVVVAAALGLGWAC